MGRFPTSPQIHQKLIKILNNAYKAASKRAEDPRPPGWQVKLTGMRWDKR